MGKVLVVVGLILVAAGLLWMAGLPIGRLPGNLVVRRGSFTFYFPIVSSVVVSVLLTLVIMWLRR